MAAAYELRSQLRMRAATFRVRFCGCGTVSGDPAIVIQEFGKQRRAHFSGVMMCQRQYACPVCCARRGAERRAELDAMMRADPNGEWCMLTLTLRHTLADSLRELNAMLMAAWRRVRATRRVRDIFDKHVRASGRNLDVTWGKTFGWHPHLHIILATTEWSEEERAVLADEWERALPGRTERHCATHWSEPFRGGSAAQRAYYVAKLAAEVVGIAKTPKKDNMTPWQIARAALSNERAWTLWVEYQEAMKGRRVLELDERAKTLARVGAETPEPTQQWRVELYKDEYLALVAWERDEPGVMYRVLETARTTDDQEAFRRWLDVMIRGSPRAHWLAKARWAA